MHDSGVCLSTAKSLLASLLKCFCIHMDEYCPWKIEHKLFKGVDMGGSFMWQEMIICRRLVQTSSTSRPRLT